MRRAFAALAIPAAFFAGCVGETEKYPAKGPPPSSARELYQRDCAWCHGGDAEGTNSGPAIEGGASTHFMLSTGRMPIQDPGDTVERRDPAYSQETIDELTDYVSELSPGTEVPDVDIESAELAVGAKLYADNCASCHSSTGVGGALTSGVEAPRVRHSSAVEVAEAMLTGPGEMPVFDEEVFSEEEVTAIAAYVEDLGDAEARGGHPLGWYGPVAEGALGLLVGVGAMLLLIRWIGTRADE